MWIRTSQFTFEFQGVLSMGADQNASGRNLIHNYNQTEQRNVILSEVRQRHLSYQQKTMSSLFNTDRVADSTERSTSAASVSQSSCQTRPILD